MDFVTSKIADKLNITTNSQGENQENSSTLQNGFHAVNEAIKKMSSQPTQIAGKKNRKFRLTKKSRGNSKSLF